jgi:hypothetical protein
VKVLSPIGGALEWRIETGAVVPARAVLGWIVGPGRCGLVAVVAQAGGRVTWRRSAALEVTWQGEVCALIEGDEVELRECLEVEREAALRAIGELERELAQLEATGPLQEALLGPQRRTLQERISTLREVSRSEAPALTPTLSPAGRGRQD